LSTVPLPSGERLGEGYVRLKLAEIPSPNPSLKRRGNKKIDPLRGSRELGRFLAVLLDEARNEG
jgi:hypothetical protein